jgi:hypothetical protein
MVGTEVTGDIEGTPDTGLGNDTAGYAVGDEEGNEEGNSRGAAVGKKVGDLLSSGKSNQNHQSNKKRN